MMFHVKHSVVETDVSRETLSQIEYVWKEFGKSFEAYAEQLLTWNKKVNLMSRGIKRDEVLKHIRHSLWIMASGVWKFGGLKVMDAGSGGGLPGIPLAMCSENSFDLVDIVEKKVLVARQISRTLGLSNVRCHHESIESRMGNSYDLVISKHAFKIADYFDLTNGMGFPAVFLKGEGFEEELNGVNIPLRIERIKIDRYEKDSFFKGKNVLTLTRQ